MDEAAQESASTRPTPNPSGRPSQNTRHEGSVSSGTARPDGGGGAVGPWIQPVERRCRAPLRDGWCTARPGLRSSPAVGEVALEARPAALFGGAVAGVAEASHALDPLVPEAVGLCEAVGVVGAEVGVEAEEGTEGCGLVVVEVGGGGREVTIRGTVVVGGCLGPLKTVEDRSGRGPVVVAGLRGAPLIRRRGWGRKLGWGLTAGKADTAVSPCCSHAPAAAAAGRVRRRGVCPGSIRRGAGLAASPDRRSLVLSEIIRWVESTDTDIRMAGAHTFLALAEAGDVLLPAPDEQESPSSLPTTLPGQLLCAAGGQRCRRRPWPRVPTRAWLPGWTPPNCPTRRYCRSQPKGCAGISARSEQPHYWWDRPPAPAYHEAAAGNEPPSLAGVSILPWRSRATQDSPHAGDIGMAHPFVLHGERLASRISSVFFTDNVSGSWHHIGAALTPHRDTSALARDHLRRQAAQAVREYSVLDAAAANAALAQPSRECPLEVTGSIHEGRHDVGRSGLVEQQYSRPAVGIDSMHPLEAPDCQAAGHGRNTRSARRLSGRSAHSVGVTIRGRVRVAYSLRRKSCMPLPSGPTNGISPRTREALRTKGRSQTPVDRRRSGRRSCCPHRSTTIAPEGHPAGAA
ncbi:hypothetical protein SUDANB5_06770 [Streptomyces sp. SudanB5_2050]